MATISVKLKKLADTGQVQDPYIKKDESFKCKILNSPVIGQEFNAILTDESGNQKGLSTTIIKSIEAEDDRHIVFSTRNSTYALFFYEN